MCSIFGFNKKNNANLAQLFFDSMRHRGPDAESCINIDDWYLGHQRLSIIDVSILANQPMIKDGNYIIFNGEIYNYLELKKEFLKNVQFNTNSDTEVLLELLNHYGISILNKLNGMFAFAWYNSTKKELILCRDRYGVKPLHWFKENNDIYFASEIKPLIKLKQNPTFNKNIINSFIKDTATDFDEQTFIDGIYQIKPGHLLLIDKNKNIKIKKWYYFNDFQFDNKIFKNYSDTILYFENLLVDAIRLRYRADVPICITLSGGLDSTTIYTLTKEFINLNIKPITFIHPNSPIDEYDKVLRLIKEYKDSLITVKNNNQYNKDDLLESLKITEFPIWNPSALAYLNIYKAIRDNGFKVVIEGHGGDEQLGGYPYMVYAAFQEKLCQKKFFDAFKLYKVYKDTLNPALNQLPISRYFISAIIKNLISFYKSHGNIKSFQAVLDESFDYKILPIVLRAFDRLSMSQSVESRSPFMDFRIVEFCRLLPLKFKVNSLGNKAILREILKKYNKDYIYKNKIKTGFASDLIKLLNNSLIKNMLKKYINEFSFDNHKELKELANSNINKEKILWTDVAPIWKIASLEMMRQIYGI